MSIVTNAPHDNPLVWSTGTVRGAIPARCTGPGADQPAPAPVDVDQLVGQAAWTFFRNSSTDSVPLT